MLVQLEKIPRPRRASWAVVAIAVGAVLAFASAASAAAPLPDRPRLIVLADMGNEPDEEQQMLHLLMCSNEIQLEGLLAVTGKFLRAEHRIPYRQTLHPELFDRLIDGYARIYPNLQRHAQGWPAPDALRAIVAHGQAGYGIAATGEGKASAGSRLITAALAKPDPRPVHIVVNAGSNTLAQALRDYRAAHSPAETTALVAKLRVFENGAQDNAGAWICHEFPKIHWVRSNYQTYCYGGPENNNLGPHTWKPHAYSTDGQDEWAKEHVRTNHGALGELFPIRSMGQKVHFMEGGGTIPWMGFVARGLGDSAERSWGGWSGRNDLVALKVARDGANIYFYARTRQPLTPRTDANWMWLPIDADRNSKTGWEGYDCILNRTLDGKETWLEKNVGGWKWAKVAKVELGTKGSELMLAVPRSALGLSASDDIHLDFKWWDHAQKPGDIMDVYLSGDAAPDARFNYRYSTIAASR